jgi:hypothetical protein
LSLAPIDQEKEETATSRSPRPKVSSCRAIMAGTGKSWYPENGETARR